MQNLRVSVMEFVFGVVFGLVLMFILMNAGPANATEATLVGSGMQCPNDIDNMPYGWSTGGPKGAEDFDHNGNGIYDADPNVVCRRIGVTDGYVKTPDGNQTFIFGFVDLTGVPENEIVNYKFQAHQPAPTIEGKEGQTLYLTETVLSLHFRPDIFDPHTVHFHGFPHAMAIFDGVPELSIAVPGGRDFTYFYKLVFPGTYPYHCHVEPWEHIQMGMTGTIVVYPKESTGVVVHPNGQVEVDPSGVKKAYDDGGVAPDTRYDVAYNLFINEVDADKHFNFENIQEDTNQWHDYKPNYFTLNGRVYPYTTLPDNDPSLLVDNGYSSPPLYLSQNVSSLITAQVGQRILLRLNSLGYMSHAFTIPGIPMHVVGEDARLLRGPTGVDVSYFKHTYAIQGGKTADIILDTTGLTPGTYFLYARELNDQSNLRREDRLLTRENPVVKVGDENRGGMMTEIRITP